MGFKFPSLIGVIHLPPLGDAPRAHGENPAHLLERAGLVAVREAETLTKAGFEGLILENFGDAPFYRDQVPPETIASLSIIAAAVREVSTLPLGINILRNDAKAALAIAAVTGCEFIRVNVLSGVAATDQGWIEGKAAELLRRKKELGADVSIFADAHVKHAVSFSSQDVGIAVEELGLRALADAVILTGPTTGRSIELEKLKVANRAARHHGIPLYLGSGVSAQNISELLPLSSGVIVSSTLRRGGRAGEALDLHRVKEFVRVYRSTRARRKKSKT